MSDVITIIVTQGDPAGIGPEIVMRAAYSWQRPSNCRLLIMGYPAHFASHFPAGARWPDFISLEALAAEEILSNVYWIAAGDDLNERVALGVGSLVGARGAIRSIEQAIDAALAGEADAVCTAPINKETLKLAGHAYPGHTEMLADRSRSESVAMMLAGGGLRVVLATIHEPLARVPSLLSTDRIFSLLKLIHRSMRDFGFENPRIGVAGLNPHAGEGGIFGLEEIEIIAPAVELAKENGINATGPWSADTLFHRQLQREFDVTLAMYHDQGLIPVKTLDFHGGVNITLGLPFVRTSPDHGTAYDIAGKGLANPASMIAALNAAYDLASRRRKR